MTYTKWTTDTSVLDVQKGRFLKTEESVVTLRVCLSWELVVLFISDGLETSCLIKHSVLRSLQSTNGIRAEKVPTR